MGGGITIPPDNTTGEEDSSLDQDSSQLSSPLLRSELSMGAEEGAVDKQSQSGSVSGDYKRLRDWEASERMRENVYRKIMQTGELLGIRGKSKEAKDKILSYTPGAWIETAGGMKRRDYDVPKTTTLLLVGPKGSGKSSLINRISKVLEDDKFASERAQVSYNSSIGDGTLFLQECMIPRGSTSFCIYDTRSLSDDSAENIKMLKHWMENGVRHGELAIRDSDSQSLRTAMMCKAHDNDHLSSAIRKVNFVIFAVNGLSVLKALESEEDAETQYTRMIASMFNCPYLAFKDDKPAVVVTHGDLLSHDERARVRVHLGELLGIPPTTQIFDIPESSDPVTESTTIDMLRYSLEHADKNFTHKKKVPAISLLPFMLLLMLLGTATNLWCMYHHAHIQQGPATLPAIQHCQCPQAHIQHYPLPQARIQHDRGPFTEEHNQKEPLPEEYMQKEPLLEEYIQKELQDPLPQALPQEQVQQDALPQDQVQQDPFPQDHVQQGPLPQDHVQQDPFPQMHVQHCTSPEGHVQHDCGPLPEILTQHSPSPSLATSTPSPLAAPSTPSVPSAHEDGSLPSSPQAHVHPDPSPSNPSSPQTPLHGPLPRVQAELEKIKTKVEKFRTKLDWSKIRHWTPSVPSAHEDGSLPSSPQAHVHPDPSPSNPSSPQTPLHGPLPRVQAELEKIKTKVEKFRTKLDWSKIRHWTPSVPSAHEDGSLPSSPQPHVHPDPSPSNPSSPQTPLHGPLPRVQAELEKIKTKVEKFRTKLDWSKIRHWTPSVPSAHEDGSLPSSPQPHVHPDPSPSNPSSPQTPLHGPLPRVQAELEKIKTKVEKFRTKLDWSKIRHLYLDEDSKIHIEWKKIRHLYLDEDSKVRIDWKKIRHLYLDD
ncbi:uncharacterized protein LOC133740373 isoform X2 [Rosa rugosa]|uniref:uncharacterized protein LOC133740373 isoform X2 n=1 Tax=Rosa rugosa TaxID=74645 RepID=UPI002B40CA24|nr:uncharacterized protein LOC133740373 isoform X2 [Rosa rugosa]